VFLCQLESQEQLVLELQEQLVLEVGESNHHYHLLLVGLLLNDLQKKKSKTVYMSYCIMVCIFSQVA
jgi:hypothetical protein